MPPWLLRDHHPEEPEVFEALQHLFGHGVIAIDLRGVDVRGAKLPHAVEHDVQVVDLGLAEIRIRKDHVLAMTPWKSDFMKDCSFIELSVISA